MRPQGGHRTTFRKPERNRLEMQLRVTQVLRLEARGDPDESPFRAAEGPPSAPIKPQEYVGHRNDRNLRPFTLRLCWERLKIVGSIGSKQDVRRHKGRLTSEAARSYSQSITEGAFAFLRRLKSQPQTVSEERP
jgi:hypothetical protein